MLTQADAHVEPMGCHLSFLIRGLCASGDIWKCCAILPAFRNIEVGTTVRWVLVGVSALHHSCSVSSREQPAMSNHPPTNLNQDFDFRVNGTRRVNNFEAGIIQLEVPLVPNRPMREPHFGQQQIHLHGVGRRSGRGFLDTSLWRFRHLPPRAVLPAHANSTVRQSGSCRYATVGTVFIPFQPTPPLGGSCLYSWQVRT